MYRNNFIFTFSNFNEISEIGIYKTKGSRELIPCEEITLANPASKVIVRHFLNWLIKNEDDKIYDFSSNLGYLHNISVRNNNKGEFMLEIYLHNNKDIAEYIDKMKMFDFKKYNIISVHCQIFDKHHDFRGSYFKIYGTNYLNYYFEGYTISIFPGTFFQTNNDILFDMYNDVISFLEKGTEIFLDLYCGVGVMSILVNKYFSKCYGIEINKNSIDIAIMNSSQNNITNCEYICSPVENIIDKIVNKISGEATIFINPPRSGLRTEVIAELNKVRSKIKQIVYLSCSLKTLKRDLLIFDYGYKIVKSYDMFIGTDHKEYLCILNK